MKIGGIQKLTLLDSPGKVACSVFLEGCNLRCSYCHNPSLVLPERLPAPLSCEAVLTFLSSRQGKLDGVCITGGEPTLQEDLPELLSQIRSLGFAIKLDTNGTNPRMLQSLLEEGLLDYAALDIKNAPTAYADTCGTDVLAAVQKSVQLIRDSGIDHEFRTTICAPLHTPERMTEIGTWLCGTEHYFLQPFADSGDLVGRGVRQLSREEICALWDAVLPYIPNTEIRGMSV